MPIDSSSRAPAAARFSVAKSRFRRRLITMLIAIAALATAAMECAAAPPAAGDTFVYQVINGYNNETRGQVSYRVQSSDADRVVFEVTTNRQGAYSTAAEISTPGGSWLRHRLPSRDQPTDYEFSAAFPAYDFPLEPGKKWTARLNAVIPATGARRSVRIDAKVGGTERIQVPAGAFDTVKISRVIYAGDADLPRTETNIVETEWYAPALGRAVRLVTTSDWRDLSVRAHNQFRGDWDIYELVAVPPIH